MPSDFFGRVSIIDICPASVVRDVTAEFVIVETSVFVKDQTFRPNLIHIHVVSVVHFVGDITARRTHIHFETDDVVLVAKSLFISVEAEKFKVEKPLFYAKRFDGFCAYFLQIRFLHIACVTDIFAVAVEHCKWRYLHHLTRAKQDFAARIGDAVEGLHVSRHKFLDDIDRVFGVNFT